LALHFDEFRKNARVIGIIFSASHLNFVADFALCFYKKRETIPTRGVSRSKNVGWTHMASVEREPITEVWGKSLQQGPGAEGHGGEAS